MTFAIPGDDVDTARGSAQPHADEFYSMSAWREALGVELDVISVQPALGFWSLEPGVPDDPVIPGHPWRSLLPICGVPIDGQHRKKS
jgi:hypothetical protein